MPQRLDLFTPQLIKAIDNWQAGSSGKARKARRLREFSRHLPVSYRSPVPIVFRQMRGNFRHTIGIAAGFIPDAISSWTSSLQVAQTLGEDHVDPSKVMLIFTRRPSHHEIILNLNDIYSDPDFMDTVDVVERHLGKRFDKGIRCWSNTQHELVLRETDIANDQIEFIGAFRRLSDVVPTIGQRDPAAPSDEAIFKELTGRRTNQHFWVARHGAQASILRVAQRAQEYLAERRIWPHKTKP